jgi:hypothetical protein
MRSVLTECADGAEGGAQLIYRIGLAQEPDEFLTRKSPEQPSSCPLAINTGSMG